MLLHYLLYIFTSKTKKCHNYYNISRDEKLHMSNVNKTVAVYSNITILHPTQAVMWVKLHDADATDQCFGSQSFCTVIVDLLYVFHCLVTWHHAQPSLASWLINAQSLLAHYPATDDNSFIGCTRPRPDRGLVAAQCPFCWQLMPISVLVWVHSFIEPDVLKTMYRSW